MNSLKRCDNYVFIETNGLKWSVNYNEESKQILILSSIRNIGILYKTLINENTDIIFNLFKQYADNTLDTNKYKISFPSLQDDKKQIIIEYDNTSLCFDVQSEKFPKIELSIYDVDYYQASAIQQLVKIIKNQELVIKQLEEQTANLTEKLDMVMSFMEFIDNNKLAEMKKAVS